MPDRPSAQAMSRAPVQVLVIPYRRAGSDWEFAVLHRADEDAWQFIAGGAEADESPEEAARREAHEEAGIPRDLPMRRLDAVSSIPRCAFPEAVHWPSDLYVVPEYAFAVDTGTTSLSLSREHRDLRWSSCEEAMRLLRWDSNRTALWELHERLARPSPARPCPAFAPGFRLSLRDAACLAAGAAGAAWAARSHLWLGLVIAFTVGHFFLFCNVLRMARPLELAWSGVFLALAGATLVSGVPGWPSTFVLSLVATVIVGWFQTRRPSYHGIAWRRINPGLRAWWEASVASKRQGR